jgi:DNA-directed RNA polymerase subunit RPC12/RpoP
MTEFTHRVGIAEIVMVRVKCLNTRCGIATEYPLDKLEMPRDNRCPYCQHEWIGKNRTSDPLQELSNAVNELLEITDKISVEIVLSQQPPG